MGDATSSHRGGNNAGKSFEFFLAAEPENAARITRTELERTPSTRFAAHTKRRTAMTMDAPNVPLVRRLVHGGRELAKLFETLEQSRLHYRFRQLQDIGDLGARQILDVAKTQHLALLLGQLPDEL